MLTWKNLKELKTNQIETIWIDYSLWKYNQYPYSSNSIKSELSCINSLFHSHGIHNGWRELMPELKRTFTGIDNINKKHGKIKHNRRPIVDIINYHMIQQLNNHNDKLLFALAQQAMLRSDEYCLTTSENDYLRLKDIQFIPNKQQPKRVIITIRARKNNKQGEPFQIILECTCGHVHTIKKHCVVHMLKQRYKKFQYDLNLPVISSRDPKKPCTNYYANAKLNQICKKFKMNTLFYGSHSWRIGKACQTVWERGDLDILMRIGGWKTVAAAKLYLRTTNVDLPKFIKVHPEIYIKSLKKKSKM